MNDLACLSDTNILLRLESGRRPDFKVVADCISRLRQQDIVLYYTPQCIAEFWNVSTRPEGVNGFGLTVEQTQVSALAVEKEFVLLPDIPAIHAEGRKLVFAYQVKGTKVYDARLVATMQVYGIRCLPTLNPADFHRYPGIQVLTPKDVLASL